jgi:hypothetical protein
MRVISLFTFATAVLGGVSAIALPYKRLDFASVKYILDLHNVSKAHLPFLSFISVYSKLESLFNMTLPNPSVELKRIWTTVLCQYQSKHRF